MPATRSSGPPTAASLQPFLMEAFENFKQRHSKQNQDLIHKNRVLLKSTAELERVIKELKNENIELRIQIQKSNSLAESWRLKAESSSHQFGFGPQQADQIRLAVLDIANQCKTIESSLNYPQPPSSNSSSDLTPLPGPIPSAPLTANCLPSLLTVRTRAELLALRERRRSQLAVEPEESRLSFINECSGNEDRSEATLPLELSQSETFNPPLPTKSSSSHPSTNQASRLPSCPSNHLLISTAHQNVAPRSKLRQELMAPFPKSSGLRHSLNSSDNFKVGHGLDGQNISLQDGPDQVEKISSEIQSDKDYANESLFDELNTGSFSAPDRAMSQFNQSSSSTSSDSDSDSDQADSAGPSVEPKLRASQQREQRTSILTSRRSKKQRRTSLTPQHILETVSPAAFFLNPPALAPSESSSMMHDLKSAEQTSNSNPSNLSESHVPTLEPMLVSQSSSAKRRDSGLTKNATENEYDEPTDQLSTQYEGWEKRPIGKKKRPRAELDAVSEEYPSCEGTSGSEKATLQINSSEAGSREGRRTRKEVNYALPSLNKKMRRPASQGLTTESRKSSASSVKSVSNSKPNSTEMDPEPPSNSNSKPFGATPSTAQSNTSCSSSTNNTSLTVDSSPLSACSSPLSTASTSSSKFASLIIPVNQSTTESPKHVHLNEADQPQHPNHKPQIVKEADADGGKGLTVETRTVKKLPSSKSKKEKKLLSSYAVAQNDETLLDLNFHSRGMRRNTLDHLAQQAEERNKENSSTTSNNHENNLFLSTSSSSSRTTTKKKKKKNLNDNNNITSSSTSKTNVLDDHDKKEEGAEKDYHELENPPLHLRGLRRMTREVAAGIDLEKLAASLSDEGRHILFNHSRRRTQSLNTKQSQL